MKAARWSCGTCGIVNKAGTIVCAGCGSKGGEVDSGEWKCPGCARDCNTPTCPGCQYRKPLSKEGIPQIFEGMKCVFTGIIPRSIPHWSEWKEWQEAEQRGAQPLNDISQEMTHLIYKEGFERSDKVRKTQRLGCGIKIVCSEWFYQSVSLGVKLDEDPYNLTLPQKKLIASSVHGTTKELTDKYVDTLATISNTIRPSPTAKLTTRPSAALNEDGEFMWLVPPKQEQPLFQDCTMVFTKNVPEKIKQLARAWSAKESNSVADADSSHLVVAPEDEKSSIVKDACQKNLAVVSIDWVKHCVQLREVMPGIGPYEITTK
eukprot:TRINITY_DN10792_c0_g1_i2.p1 TRINITY_DN10792_c0_g1~~TRINITY_DN10792_c0_g1_i2.p1  ORF type:complete len:318 (+),score=48.16 TRINITY_DN10792_c0_g1_i2:133-1086(+)